MQALVNKNTVDVSKILMAYITFGGDAGKTAVALDIERVVVENLASAENWPAKIKQWTMLQEGDPRTLQVTINRAVNLVQASRLRNVLDKVVSWLHESSTEELVAKLTVETKYGPEFKTRALCDLVKAAETAQLMTQRALGDTAEERPDTEGSNKGSQILLDVAAALNAADRLGLNSVEVVRQSLAQENPTRPASPPNADS